MTAFSFNASSSIWISLFLASSKPSNILQRLIKHVKLYQVDINLSQGDLHRMNLLSNANILLNTLSVTTTSAHINHLYVVSNSLSNNLEIRM